MTTAMFVRLAAPAVALLLALPVPGAHAQSGPSADQIINQLRPKAGDLGGPTRGIRMLPQSGAPAADTGAAAPAPHAAAPSTHVAAARPTATDATAAPSVNLTVQFANGSAELTPQAMSALDNLGRALSSAALSSYRFRIEGHTDTVGSPEMNRSLSERRAAAVAEYLTRKYGVQSARLEPVGMGEDHLLVPTPAQTPEPRNRRVQVVNIGA
jgi:outer membrane protein OmpA-like peptidoglycan-associated protein